MATNDYTLDDASSDIADLRTMVDLLNEVHQQIDSGGNVPNTPTTVNSHIAYSNQGTPSWVNDNGLQMGTIGAQTSWFPSNTVTGTGLGNLASWTIPAGDAIVNAVYETEVWGSGTQGSTAQTLQFAVVFAGNTMSTVTLGGNFMAANSSFRWRAVSRVINHTIGSSGTWSSLIYGEVSVSGTTLLTSGGSSANATNAFVSCEIASTTTVDTTVAETFGLSAAWGSTTGAPTLTSRVAIAKRIC